MRWYATGKTYFIGISPFLFVLTRHCPKGFICCENECCQESKIWDPDTEHGGGPARAHGLGTYDNTIPDLPSIALIVFWVIFALLCICGLVMSKCKGLQHDLRPADHQTPPHPPSKAPLESIWVTSVDPLPTIGKLGLSVVLNSTGTETRPPYSLRPEGPTGQTRGTRYATL
ncbi:transmembrane protein 92-like [Rattus rattus]|uniref:transmembrane protein 92-like n=1 Tax=Rattus rattus TaxID=10117 RepID=UPI0013F307C4|nr:transmembrane protein 92-like [Rattus rattus]